MAPRTRALSGSWRSKGAGLPSRRSERKRLLSVSACLVAFFIGSCRRFCPARPDLREFLLFQPHMLCRRRRFVASLLGAFFVQLGVFFGNLVKQFHHCQFFFEVFVEVELEERRLAKRKVLGQS